MPMRISNSAASREAIDAYASEGFDSSGNPCIMATLYNVGQPHCRAAKLAANRFGRKLPVENYYGWFVNSKLDELRALLSGQG